MSFLVVASLDADMKRARSSRKPSVFLGGWCQDNDWRKKIKRIFKDSLVLMDPYDPEWTAADNAYDELASMVLADYVVFYKSGEGSYKEMQFLKDIGEKDKYEVYDSLDDVISTLKEIASPGMFGKRASETLRSIVAKLNGTYKFSSTQVNLPLDLAQRVITWGKLHVPDKDLHDDKEQSMGREDEIHCTLLYGLKVDEPQEVIELVQSVRPFEVRLGLVTVFKDVPTHDVIKIDAESPEMQKLHYLMEKLIDNGNKFPTYIPHVSVCYVKKGAADKYIGDDSFKGVTFKVDEIVFSSKEGQRTQIALGR